MSLLRFEALRLPNLEIFGVVKSYTRAPTNEWTLYWPSEVFFAPALDQFELHNAGRSSTFAAAPDERTRHAPVFHIAKTKRNKARPQKNRRMRAHRNSPSSKRHTCGSPLARILWICFRWAFVTDRVTKSDMVLRSMTVSRTKLHKKASSTLFFVLEVPRPPGCPD